MLVKTLQQLNTGEFVMKKAFTLIEILIVVAIIGLIAAIGIPSFLGARQGAQENMRQVNIATVNAAKEQWAIINNKGTGEPVAWSNIAPYIGNNVTSITNLNVGTTNTIKIGNVGTSAYY
jgi:prepilin-type N-terminal cleavage/methylation domain-containing protein